MSEKQQSCKNKVSELPALKKDNARLKQEIKTLKKKLSFIRQFWNLEILNYTGSAYFM